MAEREALPRFINPELSLLAFQMRVLALAEDPATPLRERLRFLAIVSANLDDFFMVRVAGLRRSAREENDEKCEDGLTHAEQLRKILGSVDEIVALQGRCYRRAAADLAQLGAGIRSWSELDATQQADLREQCIQEIQPGLSPLAMTFSPGHPLPHLPHHALSLAVVMRRRRGGRLHLAQVEVPEGVPRFLRINGKPGSVIPIEEVIRKNLDLVYPDGRVEDSYMFRITRGGDLSLRDDAADLLEAVSDATDRRPGNPAIRVELERDTPPFVRELILESLRRDAGADPVELMAEDFHETDGLIDLRCLTRLPVPHAEAHSYPPVPAVDPLPEDRSIFDAIRGGELLFHHPFDSFSGTVLRFLREAASDRDVTTIELTLYRTGNPSPVVEALLEAARNGKRVIALVELKARFDEEDNVAWARTLERAGGHVVYGFVGLKNHAKAALVVRREGARLQRYVHVGTGNYNARSGCDYTDLSLFSARESLTADVADLFNGLSGSSSAPDGLTRGSLVAPRQLLDSILERIDSEVSHARAGRAARITAKLNGLSDAEVVRALYRASSEGVDVDLVVRGICTLRPGVPGLSDRIRVVASAGRFLEHSRIYRFANDGDPRYFIGSADLRPRNLRRRIELLVPVIEGEHQARLDSILDLYLNDATAWDLMPDGSYVRRTGGKSAQDLLIERVHRPLEPQLLKERQPITASLEPGAL